MKTTYRIRTILDVVVIYAYGVWPVAVVSHMIFNIDASALISVIPLWGRILIGIVFIIPAILIPVTLWMYSMGKVDDLKDKKEVDKLYYIGAWLGDVTGVLYYWRYIRTGKDQEFCAPLGRILKVEQDTGGNGE